MQPFRYHRGVTLIELIVVCAIIGILSAVIVVSQTAFNKSFVLSNTAYDVALTIRTAQTYGLGSRVTNALPTIRNVGYGVYFKQSPQTFLIFADLNIPPTFCHSIPSGTPDAVYGNCIYNSTATAPNVPDQLIQSYTLGNGMTISNLCTYGGSNPACGKPALTIVFARPNTRAYISDNTYSSSDQSTWATRACIAVKSLQDTYRYIYIEQTGEIHVSTVACPS